MPIEVKSEQKRVWSVKGRPIIEQKADDEFEILAYENYGTLNLKRMKRLHAVLGAALTELASEGKVAEETEEVPA